MPDAILESDDARRARTRAERTRGNARRDFFDTDWLRFLNDSYSAAPPRNEEPFFLPDEILADAGGGFLTLVEPLLLLARARFREGIAKLPGEARMIPFDRESAERLSGSGLPVRLLPILARTLVLELHVARVEGKLSGATSQERFRSYLESLRREENARGIFREYPVLARAAAECALQWIDASLEFFERLAADWSEIRSTLFDGGDPGRLVELQGGAGDAHRGGRCVLLLRFASGAKLVYKPRSLAVDARFRDLLAWLDGRGDPHGLRVPRVVERGSHGWVEFVSARACESDEEVLRFHRRLGGLLAVLHVLDATDIHYENLIAAGDEPVVVDLESIFHPRAPRPAPGLPDERLATRFLARSVLRVGLLPFQVGETEEIEGVDISGVASVGGQKSPDRVIQWDRPGTDEMRVVRERVTLEGGQNRPVLAGKEVEVAEHAGEIVEGFCSMYRTLQREREAVTAAGGPLERFAEVEVRAVLRATRAYGLLLQESFHPDLLRDALDRDRFFDRLRAGLALHPALSLVVPFEQADLQRGDVPRFSSHPGSRDVWASDGTRQAGFFEGTALDRVRENLRLLDEIDLARQAHLMRLALGTRLLNRDEVGWSGYRAVEPDDAMPGEEAPGESLRARLLDAASEVGDWFDTMAEQDGEHATWISLEFRNARWSMVSAPEDLYAGLPGIALFLGYLGNETAQARTTDLARSAVRTLLRKLESSGKDLTSVGAFQGWGGVLYALARLGSLWRDSDLIEECERITGRIETLAEHDRDLDLVGGLAGAVAALAAHHRTSGSPEALRVARRCGELLLDRAQTSGAGLAWRTRLGGDEPQTGLSHGASGIGMALAALGAAGGEDRFRDAALRAFAFEREKFWPELSRALDDGTDESALPKSVAMAWCYGAPGIAFARLRALDGGFDPDLRAELDRAIRLTMDQGFGQSHCLCHGDLGSLDLLLEVRQRSADPDLAAALDRRCRDVLASINRLGWVCGTRGRVVSPGLMNGLAGIGFGLLRLAAPRVPSVLSLD